MEHSPTEQVAAIPASNESTGQEQPTNVSAEVNQETNSGANTQGSVSDDTANQPQQNSEEQKQTQQTGGDSTTDDGLAKFAKGQGVEDISQLSERELKFLKVAHDNQKFAREKSSTQSITDATKDLGGTDTNARIAHLEYERETDRFFNGKDRSVEAKMIQVLAEKREKYGDAYAYNLSRDLDALYSLAGGSTAAPVDVEAIRREERESINRQMSSSTPNAHATTGSINGAPKVTQEWIESEYDPRNPEHRKLVDEYYSQS